MSPPTSHSDEVFTLSKLLTCQDIELSAWSNSSNLLVIYVREGDFIYYHLTEEEPIIKQIPWFSDPLHTPISIDFSPSGTFLLVLSRSCNLYVLPVLPLFDPTIRNESYFDPHDLTIHLYPFSSKVWKNKTKTKSPNSSLSIISSLSLNSSSSNSSLNDKPRSSNSSFSSFSDSQGNENLIKLKEILNTNCEIFPTVICWWQCIQNSQEIAIVGTKSGDILFVDLITGIKVGETSVKGEVNGLTICQDNTLDNIFLLITVENNEQFKLILDQKHINHIWFGRHNNINNEDVDFVDSSSIGNGNYLPSARARLQGLKQMSAEKLASLKHKIVETRSKIGIKQGTNEEVFSKITGPPLENLGSIIGNTILSMQLHHEKNVLAGYYAQTQLLTVHSMNLDLAPLIIHKLPVDTEEILLCDQVIYIISNHRTSLQVVSSKLTETRINETNDFNQDSVLGKWDLKKDGEERIDNLKPTISGNNFLAKPDLIPEDLPCKNQEKILKIYRIQGKIRDSHISKIYKLDKTDEELPNVPKAENCIIVTNKNVYFIELKENMVKKALDLILEAHELEKAERICTIFGINLQKLLELAGDIKLAALEFPAAIALFKLSQCGLLKSIVKLACLNHCNQVLSYSTMLMADSVSDMSLTEKIHLSNLMLMAYTQQILKNENNRNLMDKFMDFLKTNFYFDEVLAVSVIGQSLLFSCLRKLITYRGLILDGYKILVKLMERFLNSKVLEWSLNKNEFWHCITEIDLIEAMIIESSLFPKYFDYVSRHLDKLEPSFLTKLLKVLDPTAPSIRPVARVFKKDYSFDSDDSENMFPFGQLIELFLVTLLIKLNKTKNGSEDYAREFLLPNREIDVGESPILSDNESVGCADILGEEIWPIRKDIQGSKKFQNRVETVLSCGYGHSALIRNGSVYTWGQTTKGCLGQGPTMSRCGSPSPIIWLSCFKLEVSAVSCGKFHTAALTNNGVYTWGCSRYGQLGLGEINESPYPRLVVSLANENVISIACGQYHTMALTNQGSVFAWGWGVHGQLGLASIDDQRYPKYVDTLKEYFIVEIAAGHGHSIVLSDKGHVYSFGSSVFGQLGTGNTVKSSLPVLVKGINGKVVTIATGYFHNLALTDLNTLYTWGSSPQTLRFQAQARKKSRLLQNQNSSEVEPLKAPEEYQEQEAESNENFDKAVSELHLAPSLIDTSEVTGKIIQVSCGLHHSALITDSGGLYTWGRLMDGQFGNSGQREIQVPTQAYGNNFKADYISCGCEFTGVVEKHTGKIFCWGNNALGQLAIPVKESTTKSLDGKLVMLKSSKKIVRLFCRNAASNSVETPREIPEIPPPIFTYQILGTHVASNFRNLLDFDPDYSQRSLHFVIENFNHCINLPFILKKSLEYNNFQAASKICLLQNKYKQSIIYQLKSLQNLPKYRFKSRSFSEKQEEALNENDLKESGICSLDFNINHEDPQIQDGHQPSFEDGAMRVNDNGKKTLDFSKIEEKLKADYMDHAKYILDSYLNLNSSQTHEDLDTCFVLETGIQFWTAEKLPIKSLETFFLEKLDGIYYDFGYFLFCSQQKENQTPVLENFSSGFLFKLTSKIMERVERKESCVEYLETLSKMLINHKTQTNSTDNRKNRNIKKKRPNSETYLEAIEENLKQQWNNENFIKISCGDVIEGYIYFFSCGHFHSADSLKEDCRHFEDIDDDEGLAKKLMKIYEVLDSENYADLACPSCVFNYLRQ